MNSWAIVFRNWLAELKKYFLNEVFTINTGVLQTKLVVFYIKIEDKIFEKTHFLSHNIKSPSKSSYRIFQMKNKSKNNEIDINLKKNK